MPLLSVHVDMSGFERAVHDMMDELHDRWAQATYETAGRARELAPVRHGFRPYGGPHLKDSIFPGIDANAGFEFRSHMTADRPYAIFAERGRGDVYPKRARFLHYFTPSGHEVFSKHSGPAAGTFFMERASGDFVRFLVGGAGFSAAARFGAA